MTMDMLKQTYQEQLVKAGVEPQRAQQVAANITPEELHLIGEIWVEWAETVNQIAVDSSAYFSELVDVS